jgi:excisionase family DNA binding protein
MRPLLSIKRASELTGLSVATLYKYVLLRIVPFVKLGTRVLFDEDRLAAWIDEHRREPPKASA